MSDSERITKLRIILEPVITWYKKVEEDGEPDSSYLFDATYEMVNDNLGRSDFQKIIELLKEPAQSNQIMEQVKPLTQDNTDNTDNTELGEITYGVDMGSPDGDETALTIRKGKKLFTFVGEEAEVINALISKAREEENKLRSEANTKLARLLSEIRAETSNAQGLTIGEKQVVLMAENKVRKHFQEVERLRIKNRLKELESNL